MKHDFKTGDRVYVIESDYASPEVQKVINVTDDSEFPIVVDLSGYAGGNLVRAFRPSELCRPDDMAWVDVPSMSGCVTGARR